MASDLLKRADAFSAVGVLGSDVYDKVLVMQALKPSFPSTLFFTTDLDTSLLSPSVSEAVRNTLVVTSHGLKPGSEKKKSTWTLFRDSYQTALYAAVTQALGDQNGKIIECTDPRLFEIGRGRFFELDKPKQKADCSEQTSTAEEVSPSLGRPIRQLAVVVIVLVILLLMIKVACPPAATPGMGVAALLITALFSLCWFLPENDRSLVIDSMRQLAIVLIVSTFLLSVIRVLYPPVVMRFGLSSTIPLPWLELVGAALLITGLFSLRWLLPEYVFPLEPFSWAGGISALPPVMLILGGCALAAIYCFKMQMVLLYLANHLNDGVFQRNVLEPKRFHNLKELLAYMVLSFQPQQDTDVSQSERLLCSSGKEENLNWFLIQAKRLSVQDRGELIIFFLVGSAFLMCLLHTTSGETDFHLRSGHASVIAVSIITLVFFATTFLLCRVVHLTQCLTILMRKLGSNRGHWRGETLSAYSSRYGVPPEYLEPLLDARVIAETTELVYRFYYAPFFVISILFASRWVGFAPWPLGYGELLYLAYLLVVTTLCAIVVRREAIVAQDKISERNDFGFVAATADGAVTESGRLNLKRTTMLIESEAHGVYAPLSRQPAFRLVAISLTSGGLVVFQYFFGLLR